MSLLTCLLAAASLGPIPQAPLSLPLTSSRTPQPPRADGPIAGALQRTTPGLDRVLHGSDDVEQWAVGASWKATFADDGFTYVPAFGPQAERNHPLRFRVARVLVGGAEVPFAASATPRRDGDRVTFARGALREIYDLRPGEVEQSFVLDTDLAGDVEIELEVVTDLDEDATRPGLQFVHHLGEVRYGKAFLVRGAEHLPIETTWRPGRLRFTVPAQLRDGGPVVIDPVLHTVVTGTASTAGPLGFPDISYDASNGVYLAVWERMWSAMDSDVACEMFDDSGAAVPGTAVLVDASPVAFRAPRVANVNHVDRFLIAMERWDRTQFGGHTQIVSRTRDAGGARGLGPMFFVSDPGFPGDAVSPDVGGDPSPIPDGIGFAIVWAQDDPGFQYVVARCMTPAGTLANSATVLDSWTNHPQSSPQISQGNGNSLVPDPAWLVVYSLEWTPADVDAVAVPLGIDGFPGQRTVITPTSDQDRFPFVSSPATDATNSATWFLVTCERQNGGPRAMGTIYEHHSRTVGATHELGAVGCGPRWARAESDGRRFVVASSQPNDPNALGLTTIAWTGAQFVLHEAQQPLAANGSFPMLTAARTAGGRDTEYGVVHTDTTSGPTRIGVSRFDGFATGTQILVVGTNCNGVTMAHTGRPLLGRSLRCTIGGYDGDVPMMMLGFPAAAPAHVCFPCSLGVRVDLPIDVRIGTNAYSFAVPGNVGLVGASLALQGFSIGQGPCLSGLRTSDTVVFTIR